MFNVNCETDQHYKFYQPANVQQNRTTGVGVMAPEISVFTYSCILPIVSFPSGKMTRGKNYYRSVI
jgi:hypothetical protein